MVAKNTYVGEPCESAGHTLRYSNGNCVECMRVYQREWRRKNPERSRSNARKQLERLGDKIGECRRRWLGYPEPTRPCPETCEICGGVNKSGKALCLDHEHLTHKFRGWLCTRCNRAIGLLRDSPELARKLASYLELL